ncbi:MAG: hypothetical protein IJ783_11435 [Kiritimatiellae bacterium]|nr:hypothetical protein [Kiritimatiellia bacterium]
MNRTTEEWIAEAIEMNKTPNRDTPEKAARSREMFARLTAILAYLGGNGPEPEWPWKPEHLATPEERAQDEREWAARL